MQINLQKKDEKMITFLLAAGYYAGSMIADLFPPK
jgi:hypothetical protein